MSVTPNLRYERDLVAAGLAAGRPVPAALVGQLLLPRMGVDLHRRVAASQGTPAPVIGALTLDTPAAVRAAALTNPACPPLAAGQTAWRHPPTDRHPARRRLRHLALHHPGCPPRLVELVALDTHDPARLSAWSAPALWAVPVPADRDEAARALQHESAATWIAAAYNPTLPDHLWEQARTRLTHPEHHAALLTRHPVPDGWWTHAIRQPAIAAAALATAPARVLDQLTAAVPASHALRIASNPHAAWHQLTAAAARTGVPTVRIAQHAACPPHVLASLATHAPVIVAQHPATPDATLRQLSSHPSLAIRSHVAANPGTPTATLEVLRRDPQLTAAVLTNPTTDDAWANQQLTDAISRIAAQQRHQRPSRQPAQRTNLRLF